MPAPATLQALAYVSSATHLFTPDELALLLSEARERNREADVTGALLYSDGNFMQVLEGPPDAVQSIFQRVSASTRHRGIIELYREPIEERDFADWYMGFRELSPSEYAPLRERLTNGNASAHVLLRSVWRDR